MDDDAVDAAGQRRGGGLAAARPTRPSASAASASCSRRIASRPVLGEGAEVVERYSGAELVERYGAYEGPIFAAADRAPGALPILADDFVTTDDGTGIVHLAPAFGEDDYRVAAAAEDLRPADPARCTTRSSPTGPSTSACAAATGAATRAASSRTTQLAEELIEDLEARGLLLRAEEYEHSYPHCWRSRHAADLLRQTVVVHRDLAAARRAAGGERDGRLAPAARQARALRRLAAQQRRLGALARALLGHAAAGVALRARARARGRLLRGAGRALGRASSERPPPAVRGRGRVPRAPTRGAAGSRCGGCRR